MGDRMVSLSRPLRILLVALLTAATTSGLGITINVATEPDSSWPIWVAVGALTLLSAVLMAWWTAPPHIDQPPGGREFDAGDVLLEGEAEVRPRKGTAVRTEKFTARDKAKFIVTDSSDPGQDDK